jgi:hypothetical protein
MDKKYLTPSELNARLAETRDQKFRKKTQAQIDAVYSISYHATINNKITWQNKEKRSNRIAGIKKAKITNGSVPKEVYHDIYKNSWGADRKSGYVEKTVKRLHKQGFKTITASRIHHVIINDLKSVSNRQHKKNVDQWHDQYGFGIWKVSSPGVELLPKYDKHFKDHKFLPSIIWKIRFDMANAEPKQIRDFLLPYTNNKYITNKNGGIENGFYITLRKKRFSFLTDKSSNIQIFKDKEKLRKWLMKILKRKELTYIYMWQILNNNSVKELGPLAGYVFEKIDVNQKNY